MINKKFLLWGGVVIGILLVASLFLFIKKEPDYQNPNSLQELKQAKAEGKSEFDRCMAEVEAAEEKEKECRRNKLKARGYDDGLDCIEKYEDPICQNTERYKADVDAYNECLEENPGQLTVFDCSNLIGK